MATKTQGELRQIALVAARRVIRSQGENPILFTTASDALRALQKLSQTTPDDPASQWYSHASNAQLVLFRREWKIWRFQAAAAANAGLPLTEENA